MTRFLLEVEGVQFILSERFCQDPLEEFFGHQRSKGGRSDNPTVQQFIDNTVSLRVQKTTALYIKHGNCSKRPHDDKVLMVDDTPLQKRRRFRSKNSILKDVNI